MEQLSLLNNIYTYVLGCYRVWARDQKGAGIMYITRLQGFIFMPTAIPVVTLLEQRARGIHTMPGTCRRKKKKDTWWKQPTPSSLSLSPPPHVWAYTYSTVGHTFCHRSRKIVHCTFVACSLHRWYACSANLCIELEIKAGPNKKVVRNITYKQRLGGPFSGFSRLLYRPHLELRTAQRFQAAVQGQRTRSLRCPDLELIVLQGAQLFETYVVGSYICYVAVGGWIPTENHFRFTGVYGDGEPFHFLALYQERTVNTFAGFGWFFTV